ncbi:MAG: glutamate--tRNA ligase [Erysipelothrix sp.]|nr:glutamate--tRNA ligase [Erysipelothrix sp.]
MKKVRVRYAPSPTGHLHIGNARTALFNYLFAKHHKGDFILRIEDTDIERNVEGGEESQLQYLEWLGISPDESAQKPNPKYAPYRQMERLDIYRKYIDELIEYGYAYKCYCTSEELDADYQSQKERGIASTRYNRRCLNLSSEEIALNDQQNKPYMVRIKVPEKETYSFDDMIRGNVSFESSDIGDWVALKTNGIPTYNFAVVIDDHLMDISHVFRGEEHLSNTPRQIMVYNMLDWEVPTFAHMTLIVNSEGKKLSKRDNSIMQFMSQYQEAGYLPEAMLNFMSLLGWSPEVEEEIFSKDELIEIFDSNRLSKSPSMFDRDKLNWMSNKYIQKLDSNNYHDLVKPFLDKSYDLSGHDDDWVNTLVDLYQKQLQYGAEIVELVKPFFSEFTMNEEAMEAFNEESTAVVREALLIEVNTIEEWTTDNIKTAVNNVRDKTGIKGRPLFMGARVLTTGLSHGPDLMNSIYLIGKTEIIKRLNE